MSGSSVACQEASESHRPTGRKKLCIVTSEAKCRAFFLSPHPAPPGSSARIQRIPFKQLARWPSLSRPPQTKVQSIAQSKYIQQSEPPYQWGARGLEPSCTILYELGKTRQPPRSKISLPKVPPIFCGIFSTIILIAGVFLQAEATCRDVEIEMKQK